jgi:hypothetical protein
MLNVVNKPMMLCVVMLSVVRLNVVLLSVLAPVWEHCKEIHSGRLQPYPHMLDTKNIFNSIREK